MKQGRGGRGDGARSRERERERGGVHSDGGSGGSVRSTCESVVGEGCVRARGEGERRGAKEEQRGAQPGPGGGREKGCCRVWSYKCDKCQAVASN